MITIVGKLTLLCLFGFLFLNGGQAQSSDSLNVEIPMDSTYEALLLAIENTDIGYLWKGEVSQENRIGYIGEDFQRIQVRFISVIQNYDNPYEYFLYGKSRVKDNICEFQGSLQITEAGYFNDKDFPDLQRAYLSGDYVLFEDQICLHSGIFRGKFITSVYLDKDGLIYYDDLNMVKKDFINNEFFGEWEGYDPFEVKICNWGDYRIPFSAGLDMGQEEFKPSFRFLENGWKDYLEERERMKEGVELERWWKD